jgi:hypothetical protein
MDKLSEIYKEFKDRASNPLIASFLISWFIIHWRIPVSLFFYKQNELQIDGSHSYIHLITQDVTWWNGLILPFILAVAYTFGFSWVRMWILAFVTYIRTKSTALNLGISKSGVVDMEKYLKLRENTAELIHRLSAVIKEESSHFVQNQELTTELSKLRNEQTKLKSDMELLRARNQGTSDLQNVSLFDGNWFFYFQKPDGGVLERFFFVKYKEIFLDDGKQKLFLYRITHFANNIFEHEILLTRLDKVNGDRVDIHCLEYSLDEQLNTPNLLKGKENNIDKIIYSRERLINRETQDKIFNTIT